MKSNPNPGRVIEAANQSENINPVFNQIQRTNNISNFNNNNEGVDLNNNTAQVVENPFDLLIPNDNDLLNNETMFTQIRERKINGPVKRDLMSKKETKLFSFLKNVD